jgi:predicted DNA binding CopG/RHH family protein
VRLQLCSSLPTESVRNMKVQQRKTSWNKISSTLDEDNRILWQDLKLWNKKRSFVSSIKNWQALNSSFLLCIASSRFLAVESKVCWKITHIENCFCFVSVVVGFVTSSPLNKCFLQRKYLYILIIVFFNEYCPRKRNRIQYIWS